MHATWNCGYLPYCPGLGVESSRQTASPPCRRDLARDWWRTGVSWLKCACSHEYVISSMCNFPASKIYTFASPSPLHLPHLFHSLGFFVFKQPISCGEESASVDSIHKHKTEICRQPRVVGQIDAQCTYGRKSYFEVKVLVTNTTSKHIKRFKSRFRVW